MASTAYKNGEHLYRVCRAHVVKKGYDPDDISDNFLKNISEIIYAINKHYKPDIKLLGLRELPNVITYLIFASRNVKELNQNFKLLPDLVNLYKEFATEKYIDEGKLAAIYPSYSILITTRIPKVIKNRVPKNKNYEFQKTYSTEFQSIVSLLNKKAGLFLLYNIHREIVHVGRGTDIRARMYEFFKDDTEAKYFKYVTMENISDMHIYGIYYITKYKPILNKHCIAPDVPTINLPELNMSPLYPIYQNKIKTPRKVKLKY